MMRNQSEQVLRNLDVWVSYLKLNHLESEKLRVAQTIQIYREKRQTSNSFWESKVFKDKTFQIKALVMNQVVSLVTQSLTLKVNT